MSQFDFASEPRRVRQRPPRAAGAGLTTMHVAVAVFGALVAFAFVIGFVFVGYQRYKKATMLEQRRVYEKWFNARLDADAADAHANLESVIKPDPAKLAQYRRDKAEAQKREAAAEAECLERWGQHPSAYANYPGTLNQYYRDWP